MGWAGMVWGVYGRGRGGAGVRYVDVEWVGAEGGIQFREMDGHATVSAKQASGWCAWLLGS